MLSYSFVGKAVKKGECCCEGALKKTYKSVTEIAMKNLTRISAAIIAANCSAIAMHSQVATAQEQLILEEVVVTARK